MYKTEMFYITFITDDEFEIVFVIPYYYKFFVLPVKNLLFLLL